MTPTLIIDSHFLCHRAIHTMGALDYENENTGVIFGFLMQIQAYAKEHKTNDIIFCWDSHDSKRKDMFPGYKKRDKSDMTEEEKANQKRGFDQFDVLRDEVIPAMGFKNNYFQKGYEADDLIATTVMYHEKDFIIITADADMYQLLDFADMWNPKSKRFYTFEDFWEEWNLPPEEWIKIKSFAGCSSDTVPGLQGIGEKTAAKYLRSELKNTTKAYQTLIGGWEVLQHNIRLVELPFPGTDVNKIVPNELDFDRFIQDVCYRYSFDSFLADNYHLKWDNFFKGAF